MYSKNWKPVPYRRDELEQMAEVEARERAQNERDEREWEARQAANTLSWTLQNGQQVHIRPVYNFDFQCRMYQVKIGTADWRLAEMVPVRGIPGVVAKAGNVGLTAERKATLEAMEAC